VSAASGTGVLVSIFCRDHRALAAFYAEAFGFGPVDAVESPIFTALDAGRFVLGFHAEEAYDLLGLADQRDRRDQLDEPGQPVEAGQAGNRVHITFDVGSFDDVDEAAPAIAAAGATLVQGPFTTYYDARQVVFTDPEGNVFRISSSQPGVSDLGPSEAGA